MHASLAFPLCFLIAIHMTMSPFAAVLYQGSVPVPFVVVKMYIYIAIRLRPDCNVLCSLF